MASSIRLLLRLPPTMRQHILLAQKANGMCSNMHQSIGIGASMRHFRLTVKLCKQGGKKKEMYKNAQSQTPTPQARDLPKPQPTATPSPHLSAANASLSKSLPPKLTPPFESAPAPRPVAGDWMSTRFPRQDYVLLYVAPNHTAFFVSSYFVGIFFILGGFSYAQMFLKEPAEDSQQPRIPFFIKACGALSVLTVTAFGTAFMLAPLNMIKSIAAMRQQVRNPRSSVAMPWTLRVEVKRPFLPFAGPATMDVVPSEFTLDRHLPAAAEKVRYFSYPANDAEMFTESFFSGQLQQKQGSAISRFNAGLINAWPGIKRETRRMFLRDHMAYVRITGNGNFKLDLQNSHTLDGGKVLHKLVNIDADAKAGGAWRRFLVRILGDKNAR